MSKIGTFSVDSGMFMITDPCYLFNSKEWDKICNEAQTLGPVGDAEKWNEAVRRGLERKFKIREGNVCVSRTPYGDGLFPVNQNGDLFTIHGGGTEEEDIY